MKRKTVTILVKHIWKISTIKTYTTICYKSPNYDNLNLIDKTCAIIVSDVMYETLDI